MNEEPISMLSHSMKKHIDHQYIWRTHSKSFGPEFDSAEVFEFYLDNVRADFIDPNEIFSERAYRAKYPDVDDAVREGTFLCGFQHWVLIGKDEGRSCVAWGLDKHFGALWQQLDYGFLMNAYRDEIGSRSTRETVFEFYLRHAAAASVNPSPTFDEARYQARYPDVVEAVKAGAFVSGFHHWIVVGQIEQRTCSIPIVSSLERALAHQYIIGRLDREQWRHYFDADFYISFLCEHLKVNLGPEAAFDYFLSEGIFRGDNPSSDFDEDFYVSYYQDVADAKEAGSIPSGFVHYVVVGREERRLPRHDLAMCLEQKMGTLAEAVYLQNVNVLEAKIAPLRIKRIEAKQKLNVFVPSLDPDIMFGGYISLLNFLTRIVESGVEVVFYVCEDGQSNKRWFLKGIVKRSRWHNAFQQCNFYNTAIDPQPFLIGSDDLCLAYSAWTAYAAESVSSQLRFKKFIFFIQEHEAIFYENNSLHFLVEGAYALPHVALFNTSMLQEFFSHQKIGVFAEGASGKFLSYEHALADNKIDLAYLRAKRTKTLLFYGRPERHAGRNLFEIGVLALKRAAQSGILDASWTIMGLGALGNDTEIELGNNCTLSLRSRIPQAEYELMLRSVDVGLSLMWAPHPSILPFELAKSGAICVTNEYKSRPKALLDMFGFNIVSAQPSVDGIVDAIRIAIQRTEDIDGRAKGSKFDWPVDWDVVFSPEFITRALHLPT